jgi:NAD(P)-dependent dehydrogenase (short-subunit alcohol dehydrogenase family)
MHEKSKSPQTAIVTGASSGIGLGVTQALLARGYRVVGTSRTISKSKELKASGDLVLIDGDISKKNTAIKVAGAAISHFGRIDLLVNNAGIYLPKPFTEYTPEDFEIMISTNVAGYFFITQQVVTQMRNWWISPWLVRPFRSPSSQSPQFPPSIAPWRWNAWTMGFDSTRYHPPSSRLRCTPTTTRSF